MLELELHHRSHAQPQKSIPCLPNHLQEAKFQLLDFIQERVLDVLALFIRYRQIKIPLVLLAFLIRRPKPAWPNTADLESAASHSSQSRTPLIDHPLSLLCMTRMFRAAKSRWNSAIYLVGPAAERMLEARRCGLRQKSGMS